MKLGYVRVSTREQNEQRQIDELKKYVPEERNIFVDKISGRIFTRAGYDALKRYARSGDEIYFHELDRLGRNKQKIKDELEYYRKTGIIVRILDVPTTTINYAEFGDMAKLIMEMVNNLLIEVMSTLAESEFQRNKKRQSEGIEAAVKQGVKFGRPSIPVPVNFIEVIRGWKSGEITAVEAMKLTGLKSGTFYKLVKAYSYSE